MKQLVPHKARSLKMTAKDNGRDIKTGRMMRTEIKA
jgi:hypothetical protein